MAAAAENQRPFCDAFFRKILTNYRHFSCFKEKLVSSGLKSGYTKEQRRQEKSVRRLSRKPVRHRLILKIR